MGILGMSAGNRKRERKTKPDDLLSSVVPETTIPAAVALLRSNDKFAFPSGTAWVMLVLTAQSIGGLSKRHGRDEAKGSIIELISSDQIQTVATAEMLNEETFGIIPTDETLERMSEYSLLTGAEYDWAVVWQEPSGEMPIEPVKVTTFAQAQAVAAGAMSLKEAVGQQAWAEHSGVTEDEDKGGTDSTGAAQVAAAVADADGDADFADDHAVSSFDAEPAFEDAVDDEPIVADGTGTRAHEPAISDVEPGVEVDTEPSIDEYDEAVNGFDQGTHDADSSVEPDESVLLADQDQVRVVIARRFLSEELNLDVRLDEFNTSFAIGSPVVQIAVPESATDWLGDQVTHLNRQANADLAQLRQTHEDGLRTLYVNLMSAHIEQVIRELALDRDGSPYKALKDAADTEYEERLSQKADKIRARKSEIATDFEAQAKLRAEQAAIQAELQYKERNRSKMDREQVDATAQIEKDIENDYSHKQQQILRVRRQHAMLKMQTGQTRIFEVIAEHQSQHLKAEQDCLDQWKVDIQRIIDDNREADIAQANALATHYQTTDELGDLRREHEALMESVRTRHDARIRRMEAELDRNRNEAAVAMRERDEEWKHSLHLEKEQTNAQVARVADLLAQFETVESVAERRCAAKVADLKAEKNALNDALARVSETHWWSNRAFLVLMVFVGVLCAVAGFIVGSQVVG